MTKYVKPSTRYLSLLVFGAVCWYMLSAALDVPTRELQTNTLSTLYATAALLVLAVVFCPLFRPSLQINRTDLLAAILFAGVTLARFCHAGPAGAVRYDELLQAAMLYAALRIIYTAERRTMTVLLMLLCGFGICEAWTGIRQIYGFACSNHSLFRVTGTFFNPGPYAGFVAVAGICGVACIVRRQNLAARVFRSWSVLRRQRPAVLILGVAPYLLGWGAAILAAVVLPSTMSRAGLIAAIAGCVALLLREFGFGRRLRRACRVNPLRTVLFSAIALLLLGGAATGAYFLKRPSADGRLLMWKIDARIMLRHPLCGVGPGNFAGAFGKEQAAYFAAKERPEKETQVAGCPESGFNEYLQFGAETGIGGFVLLLLMTGTALLSLIRRGNPLGYGLLAAAVFACFSYPWSVLPLRLLFVLLLAATQARAGGPYPQRASHHARGPAADGMLRGLARIVQTFRAAGKRQPAMERRAYLGLRRTVRLRRGGRRTLLERHALGFPVSLRLRLFAPQNRRLPAEQRNPRSRNADQQRPDVLEHNGPKLRSAGGLRSGGTSLPACPRHGSGPHLPAVPACEAVLLDRANSKGPGSRRPGHRPSAQDRIGSDP